jgi:NifU-like protein involved in Fe-S cluster formation
MMLRAATRGYGEPAHNKDDPDVRCEDVMKLQIRVDGGSGKIVDARFKTFFGCGSAILRR